MNIVSNHLRRYPRARAETIQHLVRKQEMLQRLRSELKPPKRKPVSVAANVLTSLASSIREIVGRVM